MSGTKAGSMNHQVNDHGKTRTERVPTKAQPRAIECKQPSGPCPEKLSFICFDTIL